MNNSLDDESMMYEILYSLRFSFSCHACEYRHLLTICY